MRGIADSMIMNGVHGTWNKRKTPDGPRATSGRVLPHSFYIPPRSPNSHPEGAPFEHYGPLQSEEAIRYAHEILEFSRSQMA